MADVEYWEETLTEEIEDLATIVRLAKNKNSGSSEQKTKIDEAERKLRDANGTKRSYKLELRLVSDAGQRKAYEKQLLAHDKMLMKEAEAIKELKAACEKESLLDGANVEAGLDGVKEGDEMLKQAAGIQDKTQTSLDRTQQMVTDAKDLGTTTLGKLQEQNEQLQRIDEQVDQTFEHLERADLLIKNFGKRMAQDKFILCCACLNVCLLVGVIVWAVFKDSGSDSDPNRPENISFD